MARISISSASSLLSKAGHQPPSSATPCSLPRFLHQQARRRDRPRRSSRSAWSKLVADSAITIRSWMSMRRPACAPPPKIWISGSGSVTGLPCAEVTPQRLAVRSRGRVQRRPSTPRSWRCRRGAPCWACRRARSARRRSPPDCAASRPARCVGDLAVDVGHARRTSMPPSASPPSRRSMASREPREAPAGAMARPMRAAGQAALPLRRWGGRANPTRGGRGCW